MRTPVKKLRFYPSEVFNWALRFKIDTKTPDLYNFIDLLLLICQENNLVTTGLYSASGTETVLSSFGTNSREKKLKQRVKKLLQCHSLISSVTNANRRDVTMVNTKR